MPFAGNIAAGQQKKDPTVVWKPIIFSMFCMFCSKILCQCFNVGWMDWSSRAMNKFNSTLRVTTRVGSRKYRRGVTGEAVTRGRWQKIYQITFGQGSGRRVFHGVLQNFLCKVSRTRLFTILNPPLTTAFDSYDSLSVKRSCRRVILIIR